MNDPEFLVEVAGWIGAGLILAAYLTVSMGRLTGQSPLFQWMNLIGAAGFVINSGYHGAVPSAALNIIWMLIGAISLWRIWQRRSAASPA
ncbi:MAG: hypothetical protein H0W74_04865 [Sphingosinicella sp.]|nr:hypothetical protein [Sphingosinicella sp.]